MFSPNGRIYALFFPSYFWFFFFLFFINLSLWLSFWGCFLWGDRWPCLHCRHFFTSHFAIRRHFHLSSRVHDLHHHDHDYANDHVLPRGSAHLHPNCRDELFLFCYEYTRIWFRRLGSSFWARCASNKRIWLAWRRWVPFKCELCSPSTFSSAYHAFSKSKSICRGMRGTIMRERAWPHHMRTTAWSYGSSPHSSSCGRSISGSFLSRSI